MSGLKIIPTPKIIDRDLHHCCCCSPPRRTLVTADGMGIEQYHCPRTGVTMRWSEGAQTYVAGSMRLVTARF